jgi:hypothetical protein
MSALPHVLCLNPALLAVAQARVASVHDALAPGLEALLEQGQAALDRAQLLCPLTLP